jgi:hypothetical protein
MYKKQKIIIYSVNTNNFDKYKFEKSISNIFESNYNFKYFIFTDKITNLSEYKFLNQILIQKIPEIDGYWFKYKSQNKKIIIPKGISINRYIKMNPITILPKHDVSIYHDARVTLYPTIIDLLDEYKMNFDWISMKHRHRKNFNQELIICFSYLKINFHDFMKIKSLAKKLYFGAKENKKSILPENGLLIRKSNKKIKLISKEWTKNTIYTIRDQLSLPLTLHNLRNLNIKREFLAKSFSDSRFARVHDRIENRSLIIDLIFKSHISIRFLFIKIVNFFWDLKSFKKYH